VSDHVPFPPPALSSVFAPRPLRFEDVAAAGGVPACSVVMTAYQDFRFLDAAVASLLAQDFADFELIVVDDGSTEPAPVAALAARDPRIRVLLNPENVGTAVSANRGIEAARSDIIVRLDSDDIAEPGRLGALVGALRADPELGLVGSAVTIIDEEGRPLRVERMAETDLAIRWTLMFHNPFYHSATAFRRAAWEAAGRYREDEPVAQDHYLWFDMLPHVRARNLPAPLTRYRFNMAGLTATHPTHTKSRTDPIREALWRELGLTYDTVNRQAGEDASDFLRGLEIAGPARRAAAGERLLATLDLLLAERPALVRADEDAAVGRFATGLGQRLAARPSRIPRKLRRAWELSRTVGFGATARLAMQRLRLKRTRITPRPRPAAAPQRTTPADALTALLHDISPYEGFNAAVWPDDAQGWGSENPIFLEVMAKLRPGLIVEIGSWKGASAIHMGRMAKALRLDSRIICIDTWLGSAEHVLGEKADWRDSLQPRHGFPQLYFTFLANVVRAGMADRIVPLANTSDNAALILKARGIAPDLVYVDGAHEEDAVYRDLVNYWALLAEDGALIGDDYQWDSVRRAAERFAAEIGRPLDIRGNKFVLWRQEA
jgi:glycosyltransferase involved in cell wall biosynthesis/predicted O-methyltransferase YrrM